MTSGGLGRNLFQRPLHWEFFYDESGKALVRLHRIMGTLRRTHRALRSRGFFYYFHDTAHLAQGVLAYRRKADAEGGAPAEDLIVVLNFSDSESNAWISFPSAGTWREQIDGTRPALNVTNQGQWLPVSVASNYGAVYKLT